MAILTKDEFLNIKVKDLTIGDCLDLISKEENNENKLKITNNILQALQENKPSLMVSAKDILDKIVNLHNAINEINSFSDYWNEEKNIYELITDTSKFTQEEIEKMYQPKGELKRILEIVSEDPNVEEV